PARGETGELAQHAPGRHTAALAAREGHDAKGAKEVASLLHLEKGARLSGEYLRPERLDALRLPQVVHEDAALRRHHLAAHRPEEVRQASDADDVIHPGNRRRFLRAR